MWYPTFHKCSKITHLNFQGEYAIKLEINPCTPNDKGAYKLVAKNEKGEATSSIIDVILPPTIEAPVISQGLTDVVCTFKTILLFILLFHCFVVRN